MALPPSATRRSGTVIAGSPWLRTTAINGRKTIFRAKVQNVTGESYWSSVASFGTFFLGAPRTYLLSMTVDL